MWHFPKYLARSHRTFAREFIQRNVPDEIVADFDIKSALRKRLSKAEKRLNELDHLFIRIYEDNVSGRISDERFALMSKEFIQRNVPDEIVADFDIKSALTSL